MSPYLSSSVPNNCYGRKKPSMINKNIFIHECPFMHIIQNMFVSGLFLPKSLRMVEKEKGIPRKYTHLEDQKTYV